MINTLGRFMTSHKAGLVLATLLGVLTVASNIGLLATSGYLISSAALRPSTVLLLWVPIVGVRFFGIARAVFRYGERYFSHDLTFRILSHIRAWVYERLEPLAPARILKYRSGDVLSSIVSDVDTLQDFYLRALSPPIVAFFVMALVFSLLSLFSIELGFIQVVIMLVAGIGVPLLTYFVGRRLGERTVQLRTEFSADFVDSVQGMTDILAFSQEQVVIERLSKIQRDLVRSQRKMAGIGGLSNGLMTFLHHLSMWILLFVAISLLGHGAVRGVDLAVIAQTALASFEAIAPLPLAFQHLSKSFAAMKHLLELVNEKPQVMDTERDVEFEAVPDLHVQNLSFRYQSEDKYTVLDLSFTLPGGAHIAIVGSSGAGKSSLVQVLSRFYAYQEGSLRLNGAELKDIGEEASHRLIAVSPQKTHLFNTSVKENLLLANPGASIEEMEEATRVALATEFIRRLPEQFDTFVGEQGYRLSGGERQRIAIARVILAKAPVSVFDEPTSGLDAITEAELLASVHKALSGRSMIWITHRLTGLEIMDEILVMNCGRIVERGTHQQLLHLGGLYRRMWEVQGQMIGQVAERS